jgi:hypothetical protein
MDWQKRASLYTGVAMHQQGLLLALHAMAQQAGEIQARVILPLLVNTLNTQQMH